MALDPITVEVIRAALNAAAERMRLTMIKTAYNHIISESLDFGCAIFDANVQMIAQGIGLPVFQGHLGFPIEATIQDRGLEAFREGDIFIHNDPYTGNGNHLNDVAMTAPVFWDGRLTGFVSVKAHWSDNDGITLDTPVRVAMAIEVRDGHMTVDFTGSDAQVVGPFNCGDAITISACRLLLKCLTTPDDPVDEGCFRPLRVIVPRRSVLAAEEPAPTARYYVPINLLIELGLRALADALPHRIPAGAYGDQMPTIAFGTHPQTGRLFIQGDLNAGGTGARPAYDGESAMIIFAGSTARNNPVEVVESRVPTMRIRRYGVRADSGGAGKYRGGLGIERIYEFLAPAFITFSLERKATPPWGLHGGRDGAVNGVEITSPDGSVRHVRKATQHPIAAGETVCIMSGGGGGWGPPAERDPDAVRRDVREGYVSADAARRDYGVRLNGS